MYLIRSFSVEKTNVPLQIADFDYIRVRLSEIFKIKNYKSGD